MSAEPDVLVKPVGPRQVGLVVEILADAFAADPVMTWISRDPQYPRWMWRLLAPLVVPYHEAYLTQDGSGAALWLPPGMRPGMLPDLELILDGLMRFGLGAYFRYSQFSSTLEKYRPTDRYYYLFAIGVRSRSRKRGIGSALLHHVLQKCDRRGLGAYLESSNPHNLALYQQHGFEIRRTIRLSFSGPRLSLMYRRPQPA
jgi:ribosomal protein S18 acetylase RimI-like enzyme